LVVVAPLLLALIVVQPVLGRWRWRRFLARCQEPGARPRLYRRALILPWAWTALLFAGVAVDRRWTVARSLGLGAPSSPLPMWSVVAMALPFVVGLGLPLLWRRRFARALAPVAPLLPRTAAERAWFVPLALTAGFCEELLHRAFLMTLVVEYGGHSVALFLLAGSVPFGLAHAYQGVRGVVVTGLFGALATWVTLLFGSLWPAIAVHALVDLRAAFMMPSSSSSSPAAAGSGRAAA
jgi:membrane protease YdiL (CAAX protease family)